MPQAASSDRSRLEFLRSLPMFCWQKPERPMTDVQIEIDNAIKTNDVVLFMKGTRDMPQCGFSSQVVQILDKLGVNFKDVNILASNELREGIKTYSNWPTTPQLYIKGEFVGGCDITREMYEAGELQTLLREKGIKLAA
jgi:monothiol glutaredoxin